MGTAFWFVSFWWVGGSTGWIERFLKLRDSKGLNSLDNVVLLSPKLGALRKGKSKAMMFQGLFNLRAHVSHFELGGVIAGQWAVGIPHEMQDVISHLMVKGLPGAPKQTLRHVLHFEKLGCAIGALPCLDTAGYRGWH
eukprot:9052712-Ditylum_brightwellii.AAC.1